MKTTLTALTALMIFTAPLAAETGGVAPATFVEQQNPSEVVATDFMGTPVVNKDGQRIGQVANLVFDQGGRIELAVVGVGGFLGLGAKDVAVPFDSLKSDIQNNKHVLILDATKDQLKVAPTYTTLSEKAFNERVANWRAKASENWKELKDRASKAYQDAKTKVNESR